MSDNLTERQARELAYHREHARQRQHVLDAPFTWDVLDQPGRRWWNAYWAMFDHLVRLDLAGREVLVVGCGFGDDALRIAKLGARVSAFDLSPDSLDIARALAEREGLTIDFQVMPAEQMRYDDRRFDLVVARDILHHVDVLQTMREIVRVAKPGATVLVNEIYSHTATEIVRRSRFVERVFYPAMQRLIYGTDKPYITADERKLTQHDLAAILQPLERPHFLKHFNVVTTRLVPDRVQWVAMADRTLLAVLKPWGHLLAGRVLFAAKVAGAKAH